MKTSLLASVMFLVLLCAGPARAQEAADRSSDRGDGLPTSMFGTYIRAGELLVYPFFEYYRDNDLEYEPGELGDVGTTPFRGRFRAREGLLFLAYGISDRLAVELEASAISASLQKSPLDESGLPARLEESGIGDVESQVRWRWNRESPSRPEWFSYYGSTGVPDAARLREAEQRLRRDVEGHRLGAGAGVGGLVSVSLSGQRPWPAAGGASRWCTGTKRSSRKKAESSVRPAKPALP